MGRENRANDSAIRRARGFRRELREVFTRTRERGERGRVLRFRQEREVLGFAVEQATRSDGDRWTVFGRGDGYDAERRKQNENAAEAENSCSPPPVPVLVQPQ